MAISPQFAIADDIATYSIHDIWNDGQYNSFTDLTRYDNNWYATFRVGTDHSVPAVGKPGGQVRVIESPDGQNWSSVALLSGTGDLRDPKLSVTPDNRLMVTAGDLNQSDKATLQSLAWFSSNGTSFGAAQPVVQANDFLWRLVWQNGTGYGITYGSTTGSGSTLTTQLVSTTNGVDYATLASPLNGLNQVANEAGLTFLPNGSAVALVRRDWKSTAAVGVSTGDFSQWTWVDSNMQVGGPTLLALPDGRILAGSRLYLADGQHTALSWLDPNTGNLNPFIVFPKGPDLQDTGYPGLYYDAQDNDVWMTWYTVQRTVPVPASGIDVRSDIFLAQIVVPVPEPGTLSLVGTGLVAGVGLWLRRRKRGPLEARDAIPN